VRSNVKSYIPFARHIKSLKGWIDLIDQRRHIQIAPQTGGIHVFYGHEYIPKSGEVAIGGIVKFQHLLSRYPNSPKLFNILCLVSSRPPKGAHLIAKTAQKKGAKLVWNQNGVAYPASQPDWKARNAPMSKLLHRADYVFYQSEFCRLAGHEFLGERKGNGEVLYNSVNTTTFTPANKTPNGLNLLLGGTQYQYYRFETAIQTLIQVRKNRPDARLLVTGALCWHPDPKKSEQQAQNIIRQAGLTNSVELIGPYTQQEAPGIFQRAHILLHTKYNDPCPGLVVEAIACGLPVVYSQSGGVPELVGEQAGIGIPAELNWEKDLPPDPEALSEAALTINANREPYAQAARKQAVEKFDIKHWIKRYCETFEALTQ
jgi:glycosyltransferase involved in cell wall biosynthesis